MATTSNTVELILKAKDETANAVDGFIHRLDGVHERIRAISNIAIGNLLGTAAFRGLDDLTSGILDFGKSMVTANAQIEVMRQRLNILYGSAAEGAQAFAFLKQNELTEPFNVSDILAASTQLVSFRQDLTQVLQPLEDVAGGMGQTLPIAARAFTDAMSGRFQMLKNDLGISKEQLVEFGLQMNKAGHITNQDSFISSFIGLANSRFKGGADQLSHTWTGMISSMESQWMYFKANVGQGAFTVLEQQLGNLVRTLQNPANSAAIQQFEGQIGAGLATATMAAINFGRAIGPYIGSAIVFVARAWPIFERAVSIAFDFAGGVVSKFANWLQNTGFPAIELVINAIGHAWQDVYPTIATVLQTIGDDFSIFVNAIAGKAGPLFQGLAGAFTIGMGGVELVFGGALDLLSGNWHKFQDDWNNGINTIIAGAAGLVAGIEVAWGAQVGEALMGPWTTVARGIREVFSGIAPFIGVVMGAIGVAINVALSGVVGTINGVITGVNGAVNLATSAINGIIDKYNGLMGIIPGMGGHKIPKFSQKQDLGTLGTPSMGSFDDINASIQKAMKGAGIGPDQVIRAGVTDAQFKDAIEKARQRVIADMTGLGDAGKPVVFSTASGPGADVLAQIKALFKGLGGKMTMKDLLDQLGLTDLGKGRLGYSGTAIPNRLPVLGGGPPLPEAADRPWWAAALRPRVYSTTTDTTAAARAGQPGATGRVPLGALGATFMQTVATTAGMHTGTNPAVKAAERQADLQASSYSEEKSHTRLLASLLESNRQIVAALAALGKPLVSPTPPNVPRQLGVFRPVVN